MIDSPERRAMEKWRNWQTQATIAVLEDLNGVVDKELYYVSVRVRAFPHKCEPHINGMG